MFAGHHTWLYLYFVGFVSVVTGSLEFLIDTAARVLSVLNLPQSGLSNILFVRIYLLV